MFNVNLMISEKSKFKVGNVEFDAMTQSLSCDQGTLYLRQKLNDVLYLMVINQSKPVSRHELIEKVWNGNIYTGTKAVTHSVCELRKAFQNLGADDIEIKTLPKRGYILKVC
ncbi:winged helix-turn-helix domain-containing protein [Aliikangiella sp. G2MR2-5]|uniref:winged helix-turn-helix domain-containing protein n=1 Tax=Aliikangiella sp. G2MR2-5 TaxID=2788943 RepID=UPI0018A9DD5D|nr:winged helix-turn-helix domain-containing protein [Aliikangiella sp. G2MR2-5]